MNKKKRTQVIFIACCDWVLSNSYGGSGCQFMGLGGTPPFVHPLLL